MSYRLRLLRESDLETVMHWRMLPEVTRYMYTDPQLTLPEQRAWFERLQRSQRDLWWIIEQVDPCVPLGVLCFYAIDPTQHHCAWGYYLGAPGARGIGLAKTLELNAYAYAFEHLGLNKLWCEVFSANDRVVALHEKFGSRTEGVLRQHICKNGEFLDVVRMGILRSEWPLVRSRWSYTPIEIESRPEVDAALRGGA